MDHLTFCVFPLILNAAALVLLIFFYLHQVDVGLQLWQIVSVFIC